jgi:hypothetical protein
MDRPRIAHCDLVKFRCQRPVVIVLMRKLGIASSVVDAMESVDRLRPFSLEGSGGCRIGYGLSIAGHGVVALLLIFGIFERIESVAGVEIPLEVVMEMPPEAARQDTPAAPAAKPAVSAPAGADRPSGIPLVDDVDSHAKAPLAALNVNGIDRPIQPGQDGRDPSVARAGVPLPLDPNGEAFAARGASDPSKVVVAPIGPAPLQMTAREPGEDEWTAIKEQEILCGIMAKHPQPAIATRKQARVKGFATSAQALRIMRSSQARADRHLNPNYIKVQRLFVETLDERRKSIVVVLPPGLTLNVGDVIEFDPAHIDPADSCYYIPNLAVRKV